MKERMVCHGEMGFLPTHPITAELNQRLKAQKACFYHSKKIMVSNRRYTNPDVFDEVFANSINFQNEISYSMGECHGRVYK